MKSFDSDLSQPIAKRLLGGGGASNTTSHSTGWANGSVMVGVLFWLLMRWALIT